MIKLFKDGEALARAAAELIAEQARLTVESCGRFSLLLAGGETPRRCYQLLAQEPLLDSVPWHAVHFFWGDERCVGTDDPRSNALMAQNELLQQLPVQPEQIHPIRCGQSPQQAADAYQAELVKYFAGNPPRFDLALLGLGDDGHTASLLPGSAALAESGRWSAVTRRPEEDFSRVTLTAPIINQAALILFLVAGSGKAPVLGDILNGATIPHPYPAQLICPTSGELLWFVDRGAAGMLNERIKSLAKTGQ